MVYIITYFPIRGRAELARLICEEGQIAYKNKFIEQNWKEVQHSLPYGQVPVLEDEGDESFVLPQSIAISRHLAREASLIPSNPKDAARADAIVDTVVDIRNYASRIVWNKPEERAKEIQELREGKLKYILTRLQQNLTKNGGKYFVLKNDICWADIAVFWILEESEELFLVNLATDYPSLYDFKSRMAERPNIKNYINSSRRPKHLQA